jgi:hypothetical protein
LPVRQVYCYRYTEAAVLSDRADLASQLQRFLDALPEQSTKIDAPFLKRITALFVNTDWAAATPSERGEKAHNRRLDATGMVYRVAWGTEYPGDVEVIEKVASRERERLRRGAGVSTGSTGPRIHGSDVKHAKAT